MSKVKAHELRDKGMTKDALSKQLDELKTEVCWLGSRVQVYYVLQCAMVNNVAPPSSHLPHGSSWTSKGACAAGTRTRSDLHNFLEMRLRGT